MRMTRWCLVYVLVGVPFADTVQAQNSDSATMPTPASSGYTSSLAISMAGTGSASPIPDSCPTGTAQLLVATDQQEYVLVCSIDCPNNDLVAYNAVSIADCIQTCENVNQVYPNAPCVGISYTPSYDYD